MHWQNYFILDFSIILYHFKWLYKSGFNSIIASSVRDCRRRRRHCVAFFLFFLFFTLVQVFSFLIHCNLFSCPIAPSFCSTRSLCHWWVVLPFWASSETITFAMLGADVARWVIQRMPSPSLVYYASSTTDAYSTSGSNYGSVSLAICCSFLNDDSIRHLVCYSCFLLLMTDDQCQLSSGGWTAYLCGLCWWHRPLL